MNTTSIEEPKENKVDVTCAIIFSTPILLFFPPTSLLCAVDAMSSGHLLACVVHSVVEREESESSRESVNGLFLPPFLSLFLFIVFFSFWGPSRIIAAPIR